MAPGRITKLHASKTRVITVNPSRLRATAEVSHRPDFRAGQVRDVAVRVNKQHQGIPPKSFYMLSHLCFSVTFLDPTFHGRTDGGEPEWPPSPLRLFQSLVAAAYTAWINDAELLAQATAALEWLERQLPPVIVTPASRLSQPYRLSVPNNAMDIVGRAWQRGNETGKDANPATHKAMKMVEGTSLVDGDSVHYLWPLGAAKDDVLGFTETLSKAAQNLFALGWGIDMAVGHGRVISDSTAQSLERTGERWSPLARDGQSRLRVPTSGSLNELRRRHSQFLRRVTSDGGFAPVQAFSAFQRVGYAREQDRPARPFAAFQLLHPEEQRFRSFRGALTAKVAAMTRHAVAVVARDTGHTENDIDAAEWLDQYVHGHNRTNETRLGRFSYLPLPTIDPREVVGGIRRMLVAEPVDGTSEHVSWLRRILSGQPLLRDPDQKLEAILAPLPVSDTVLRRYVETSGEWATVTPVVLPWGDRGKPQLAERQFLKALRHAGYRADELDDLELRREPFWRGAELARRYFVPKHLLGTANWHVRIRWRHSMSGPLVIGSGRFCGLGLFAAWQS